MASNVNKSTKIELAIVDEFKKQMADAIKLIDIAAKGKTDIELISNQLKKDISLYLAKLADLSDSADDMRIAYKELGMDFDQSNYMADFRKAFQSQRELTDLLIKIKTI